MAIDAELPKFDNAADRQRAATALARLKNKLAEYDQAVGDRNRIITNLKGKNAVQEQTIEALRDKLRAARLPDHCRAKESGLPTPDPRVAELTQALTITRATLGRLCDNLDELLADYPGPVAPDPAPAPPCRPLPGGEEMTGADVAAMPDPTPAPPPVPVAEMPAAAASPAAKRVCSVPWCNKPHLANGYCATHNERRRVHGDPLLCKRRLPGSLPGAQNMRLAREVSEGQFEFIEEATDHA